VADGGFSTPVTRTSRRVAPSSLCVERADAPQSADPACNLEPADDARFSSMLDDPTEPRQDN
jgi:hypothetical protein